MPSLNRKIAFAAAKLVAGVMERHGLESIDELECPDLRALAEALREEHTKRKHGPGKAKRGIGVHSSADLLAGF